MKKITRFHAVKILEWCMKRYGRSNKAYPTLQFRKLDYLNNDYADGEYDYEEGFIYVNSQSHKTLEDLADTIIHEYVHYRYHTALMYDKNDEKYGYEKNPLEKQAVSTANRDQKKCVQELKKYFHQFND